MHLSKNSIYYEPYINLISAISNSDNDKIIRNSAIVVYDIFDKERLVAVFSKSIYCAKFFKTTTKVIDTAICRNQLRHWRYKIERIYLEEE